MGNMERKSHTSTRLEAKMTRSITTFNDIIEHTKSIHFRGYVFTEKAKIKLAAAQIIQSTY
jgi:hypothetical protein